MSLIASATRDFVACTTCRTKFFHAGKTLLTHRWLPPRGWAGSLVDGPRDIVMVALNPGALMRGELRVYRCAGLPAGAVSPPSTVTQHEADVVTFNCTQAYFTSMRSRDHVFHRKSVAYARALLALALGRDPGIRGVRDRVWFTDAFKCSTRRESGPRISSAAFRACRTHLDREIEILKPRLIVALGQRVGRLLADVYQSRLVTLRHPSNGCPPLDSKEHDASFVRAAAILKVAALDADVRASIHRDMFPR